MANYVHHGPDDAVLRFVLAHGAGAGVDSAFFKTLVAGLLGHGAAVTLITFDYMRQIEATGRRRPPPAVDKLVTEYAETLTAIKQSVTGGQSLIMGGKSLGGRVASMVACDPDAATLVRALVCFGYPFHPPHKPQSLRTAHFDAIRCPTLILQGERDPFGDRACVEVLDLPASLSVCWIDDGDHDFGPRGRSPATRSGNIASAATMAVNFAAQVVCAR